MKILFLSENYFPNVSGVPVVVRYLAEGLTVRGHDVAIATSCFNNEPFEENIGGVKVFRFAIWKNRLHRYCGDRNGYVSFVKGYGADVIIVECSQCITTDLILPHLKGIQAKKIFHSHGFSGMELKPFAMKGDWLHTFGNTWNWIASQWYFGHALRKYMPFFDASICLSELDSSREYLKQHTKKSFVLDNAANDMFFNNEVQAGVIGRYAKLENACYVMSCANYTVVKNQKDIIEQYYKSESSKQTSLVCIGSFPTDYYKKCVAWVKQLETKVGHRDVHLLYGVGRTDIPSIMAEASLYLVASRYEQYSISIIEAMSQGLPFISMNTGNARLLPGGVTINQINDMHKKIDHLLTNHFDYERYAESGKKFAYDNCRINAVVDKLAYIINNI